MNNVNVKDPYKQKINNILRCVSCPFDLRCFDAMSCYLWPNEREAAADYKEGLTIFLVLPKNVSRDDRQTPYCAREVRHSPLKWVRGESSEQHVLTTCDPHLNSFHHDISLNQDYKRLHCTAWRGLGWTRVIVVQKKKARAGWSFLPPSMEMAQ